MLWLGRLSTDNDDVIDNDDAHYRQSLIVWGPLVDKLNELKIVHERFGWLPQQNNVNRKDVIYTNPD